MSPRTVDPAALADARSETPHPLLLVRFETGDPGTPFLRYTSRDHAVEYGGETFEPRALEIDVSSFSNQSDTGGPRLRTMDLDGVFASRIARGFDFSFCRVRLWRTFVDAAGGDDEPALVVDDWFIDFYERAAGAFSFALKPMVAAFSTKIPLRSITRAVFPGVPDPD